MDFAVSTDPGGKLNESKRKDKYPEIKEVKTLWNMRVTIVSIVIGAMLQSPKDWYKHWKTWK